MDLHNVYVSVCTGPPETYVLNIEQDSQKKSAKDYEKCYARAKKQETNKQHPAQAPPHRESPAAKRVKKNKLWEFFLKLQVTTTECLYFWIRGPVRNEKHEI